MDSIRRHLGPYKRSLEKWALRRLYPYTIPYIKTRNELPHLLNARGLIGSGAEIGVQRGKFSEHVLTHWTGHRLYSIDPWREFNDEEYDDAANVSQAQHDAYFNETCRRLERFGDRSHILRMTSEEAAWQFEPHALDFVYIDAQHHYDAVKADIARWWPIIRPGGLLSGDDYLDGVNEYGQFGVKSAVDEWAERHGLTLHVSQEPKWRSWFLFKPTSSS